MQRLICISILLATFAFGQTTSTSILGTVTDTSGAVMAGAKIILTNVRTSVKSETVTTSSGDFLFPLLEIGQYQVAVEAAGFKSEVRKGILLQINEKVRVDFNLTVGQVTERVEVTAAAATLKTDEASTGGIVEQRRI